MARHDLAFGFDAPRRADFVRLLRAYIDGGHLLRGTYGTFMPADKWRGCSVACALLAFDVLDGRVPRSFGHQHGELAELLGVPRAIVDLDSFVFENLVDEEQAQAWPLRFYGSLVPGLDLTAAWPRLSRQLNGIVPRSFARLLRATLRGTRVPDAAWTRLRTPAGLGMPAAASVGEALLDLLRAMTKEQHKRLGPDVVNQTRFLDRYGVGVDDFTGEVFAAAARSPKGAA